MARRARREFDVISAESHRDACTGRVPYGVLGDIVAKREVRSEKCFDSSSAILAKSEKKAGGRSGLEGPNRAMMSHLTKRTFSNMHLLVRTNSRQINTVCRLRNLSNAEMN
jgi:hypothetical protein